MVEHTLFEVVELAFAGLPTDADPYLDAGPRITFTAPSGQEFAVLAFQDAGHDWTVRFAPGETGVWRWSLRPAGSEAAPAAGSFVVGASLGRTAWRRHGPLTRHPSQRGFAHADGTPVFWLADTAWSAPAHATLDEWQSYLEHRSAQGFNVVQINALPQWDASGPPLRQPFVRYAGRVDVTRPDPHYFDTLDKMIAQAAEAGLIPAIVVLWFDNTADDNLDWGKAIPRHGPFSHAAARALARHLVARYEAYGATWFVSGDTGFTAPGAIALYDAAAEAIIAAAARPPLITAHLNGSTTPSDALGSRDWLGYVIYQSCHFRDSPDRARRYTQAARALVPQRPVLNSEPCYDSLRMMDADNVSDERFGRDAVRRISWISVLAGASAGVSYGAHGVWPWHHEGQVYAPMHYGLPLDWRRALTLESANDLARLRRFCETLPWWEIAPTTSVTCVPPGALLASATAGRATLLAYVQGDAVVVLPGPLASGHVAEWFDPKTGATEAAQVTPDAKGVRIPTPAAFGDAVLLVRGL